MPKLDVPAMRLAMLRGTIVVIAAKVTEMASSSPICSGRMAGGIPAICVVMSETPMPSSR
jgi:hypothetical protein